MKKKIINIYHLSNNNWQIYLTHVEMFDYFVLASTYLGVIYLLHALNKFSFDFIQTTWWWQKYVH